MPPDLARYDRGWEYLEKMNELVDEEEKFLKNWFLDNSKVCCDSPECSDFTLGSAFNLPTVETFF